MVRSADPARQGQRFKVFLPANTALAAALRQFQVRERKHLLLICVQDAMLAYAKPGAMYRDPKVVPADSYEVYDVRWSYLMEAAFPGLLVTLRSETVGARQYAHGLRAVEGAEIIHSQWPNLTLGEALAARQRQNRHLTPNTAPTFAPPPVANHAAPVAGPAQTPPIASSMADGMKAFLDEYLAEPE